MAGWDYPISQEALVLADIFDLDVKVHSDPKRPAAKPHPIRPFETRTDRRKYGNTAGRTRAEVISILERARRGELSEGRSISA